ncbi:hypothetical protein EK904_001914 [Melospiza melodia maxima]|nr:hypothetical protein EK904_001914 [Melospiza melodia maxima]
MSSRLDTVYHLSLSSSLVALDMLWGHVLDHLLYPVDCEAVGTLGAIPAKGQVQLMSDSALYKKSVQTERHSWCWLYITVPGLLHPEHCVQGPEETGGDVRDSVLQEKQQRDSFEECFFEGCELACWKWMLMLVYGRRSWQSLDRAWEPQPFVSFAVVSYAASASEARRGSNVPASPLLKLPKDLLPLPAP